MWFHQRTGRGTAVTVGVGSALLGLFFVGIVLTNAPVWWLLAVGVVVGTFWWTAYVNHRDTHGNTFDRNCRWCSREIADLRAQEEAEEARQLRERYRRPA